MLRLNGSDAVFLYSETPTTPMHTLKISIFAADQAPTAEMIKAHLESTIHRIPSLRWRILPTPFALHHPVAVDDPDFDLDFHLRHVALPPPGTHREFEDMVGQISAHALDRHRPLWELWVVHGLEGERVAFVMKIHHALADGLASVQLFTRLITEEFDDNPPAWKPQPLPGPGTLVWRALLSHFRHDARRFPEFLRNLRERRRALKRFRQGRRDAAVRTMTPKPHCRFNGALTTQRKFATASLPLAEFKAVKEGLGGTVNDAVLAVVAGALRQYLLDHGDSVDEALIAIIPVSADEPGTERVYGNNFGQIGSRLHIREEDTITRYNRIRESTDAGKSELEIFGRSTMPQILHFMPPALYSLMTQREYRKQSANRPKYSVYGNVSVSNVPGPRKRLRADATEMETLYSVGPLMEGCGLNITVWSYVDQLNFSLISCKRMVPDLDRITAAIEAELDTLSAVAAAAGDQAAPGIA